MPKRLFSLPDHKTQNLNPSSAASSLQAFKPHRRLHPPTTQSATRSANLDHLIED
ncbi:unnamed protein product [Rhodiola kirilowii]